MTPQVTWPAIEDDIRLYPNHEEDDAPEGTLHQRWSVDEEAGEALRVERVHLRRLTDQGYVEVDRQPNGRLRSAVLDLEIGVDETHNLRLYTLDGEPLLTYEEAQQARAEAERARAAAEERARTEARERAAAERRADQEAHERAEAEGRAEREARERATAEERARELEQRVEQERAEREALEREVAGLRARLTRDDA